MNIWVFDAESCERLINAKSKQVFYCTLMFKPSEWETNSGAYIH